MNIVEINSDELEDPSWLSSMEQFTISLLKELGREDWEVSILIVGKDLMKDYNKDYRQKESSTDVLSFPQVSTKEEIPNEGYFLAGDIIICPEDVMENASYFKVDFHEELMRVVIHGLLHLSGWDHETNEASEPMLMEQEKILSSLISKGVKIS